MMNEQQVVRFTYRHDQNHSMHHVNGVYGGFVPGGELVANFYFEHMSDPTEQKHIINPDGTLGNPRDGQDRHEAHFTRRVSTSISMSAQFARILYNWLGSHLKDDQAQEGEQP